MKHRSKFVHLRTILISCYNLKYEINENSMNFVSPMGQPPFWEHDYCLHSQIKRVKSCQGYKCQMCVYSGHALSYTKLVHRHATQTEGNKYFKHNRLKNPNWREADQTYRLTFLHHVYAQYMKTCLFGALYWSNRPFVAKPSCNLLFIKVWASIIRMPEIDKAWREYQNGQVWVLWH